jgi:hypothetical protein
MRFPISEEWARTVDGMVKLAGVFALIVGGWWTVYQYFQSRQEQLSDQQQVQEQERQNRIFEEEQPAKQKRLELYLEMASAVGTIVTNKNQRAVAKAKEDFLALYYGPVRVVAAMQDRKAMADFDHCLEQNKCQPSLKTLAGRLTDSFYTTIQVDWVPQQPKNLKVIFR